MRPVLSIVLASLVAVVINCYPVIFSGKSFVSPASVWAAVYTWWPPLPGMQASTPRSNQHGSDTGAIMWAHVPWAFVESRSLLDHGELPLWNRYNNSGNALLGQAVSMFGDPLHSIVLLGRGSAWAWDIKYLTAKFLFCVGFGLLVLRLLRSSPLSLIYAALGAYSGAYFYILNHPSFFVFSYTPWILLSAIELLDLQSPRALRWGLVWLLANFACFTGGHIEAAVVLIGGLNLAALTYALTVNYNAIGVRNVLGRMGVGTFLFLGLTTPWWLSFLASLQGSYSSHMDIRVDQLPLSYLPGLFDDLFYPLVNASSNALGPETSLLVLVGCILSGLHWRQLKTEPFLWVNTGAILLWGGCVFGWVPDFVLATIPFLNRVGHIATDFSYLLVIHLTLQSAYGFKCLAEGGSFQKAIREFAWVAAILAAMIVGFYLFSPFASMQWTYFLIVGTAAIAAPLLFAVLKSHNSHMHTVGWVAILALGFIPQHRFAFYDSGGQEFLMIPGPRIQLDAPSKAITNIKADTSTPFRVTGLQKCFIGDYPAAYEIEDIRSCDPLTNGELAKLIHNFPGFNLPKGAWVVDLVDPIRAQPLLNLLNVKYLLAHPSTQAQGVTDFRITERSDFLVLENQQVWPRAYFSTKVVPISTHDEFIQHLIENAKQPFVALSKDEIAKQPGLEQLESAPATAITPATNYRLLPNSTSFDIHATSAGVVCLTEGQAKDFSAKANNEPKEVLTVNQSFKGIYLDKPGDYHIEFTYRPGHWRLACVLFWISVTGVAIISLTPARRLILPKNS